MPPELIGTALIDPTQVERFRADLLALTGAPPSATRRLGVAVSGGGDSLALLLLAHAAWPHGVAAATVDHGVREESAAEGRQVSELCARLGVDHTTLVVGERPAGNLQDWARTARYRRLADWARASAIDHVATGHHRDDVAETFLMRAARGVGVRGLAAMPAVRPLAFSPVLLIRPLLGWSRVELTAIVSTAGVEAAADPSNLDPRFDRARVRRLLAEAPDLPTEGIARTASNLRDAEEAIEWTVLREVAARCEEQDDGVRLNADGLPFELKRRLATRAIETVRQQSGFFAAWRETAVAALVRALDAGDGGTVADVLAIAHGTIWRFSAAPPRRADKSVPDGGK